MMTASLPRVGSPLTPDSLSLLLFRKKAAEDAEGYPAAVLCMCACVCVCLLVGVWNRVEMYRRLPSPLPLPSDDR